ncbi:hypothetical protein EPI10_024070 [Gossypium australe]|uniref:Uncharacterized protein n=1 Tax=Gossypium australe TaxID=47621 RepID=A0A5B6VWI2_9ROSI|nr:hypothetical protein EPI10_024070 [Gossypium australe]
MLFKSLSKDFSSFWVTYNLGNKNLMLTQLMKESQFYELMLNDVVPCSVLAELKCQSGSRVVGNVECKLRDLDGNGWTGFGCSNKGSFANQLDRSTFAKKRNQVCNHITKNEFSVKSQKSILSTPHARVVARVVGRLMGHGRVIDGPGRARMTRQCDGR